MAKKKNKEEVPELDGNNKVKDKAFDKAMDNINEKYGDNTLIKLGESPRIKVDVIPTGALSLDLATGIEGIPKGRMTEIFGPESSGKSTLCLTIAKYCQKQGGRVVYIDAEHSVDIAYAKMIGVNVDELIFNQPDYGEQALDITDELVKSGAVDLIIIDSLAALVPKAELEGEMEKQHMALQARLISKAMRKLTAIVHKNNTAVIFINQLRNKVGRVFGNPEDTPGGRALKFYASMRLDIRRTETLKKGDEKTGNLTRVRVVKNKLAVPFKEAHFEIIFGKGIKRVSAIISAAEEMKVIRKEGKPYYYGEEKLGAGKNNMLDKVKEDKKLCDRIEKETRKKYFEKQK